MIIIFTGAWLVGTMGLVLVTALRNHKAHQFFKKNAPGLPVLPNPNLFTGHAGEMAFKRKSWQSATKYHKLYGKTYGFYYGKKAWASSIDLDLLKTMLIDEADDNINRTIVDIPIKELEQDMISFSENDQWRRIRRAVAPAFT